MGGDIIETSIAERGVYKNEGRGKQLIKFDGMQYDGRFGIKNVSPTDYDGVLQLYRQNCFIFFDIKYRYYEYRKGQIDAYTENVDGLLDGGRNAVFIVSLHDVEDVNQPVYAKDTIVEKYYYRKKWHNILEINEERGEEPRTLNIFIENLLTKIGNIKYLCNGFECNYTDQCNVKTLIKTERDKLIYMPSISAMNDLLHCKRDYRKYLNYFAGSNCNSESGKRLSDLARAINSVGSDDDKYLIAP